MSHIIHAITTWWTENSPLITTGVITGIITLFISIIVSVFLAPLRAQHVRRSAEKRDEHLTELKRHVLQPMLTYLNKHVLPVIEHRRANVGVRREFSRKPMSKSMENPIVVTQRFSSYDVNEPPPDSFVDARGMQSPDGLCKGPLYDDARHHHFQDLIQLWERVISAFVRYNERCLRYAEELRTAILDGSPLPESGGDLSESRYVHARGAALFVFWSQLGFTNAGLSRTGGTPDTLRYQNAGLALGSPEEINKCVETIDTLVARRNTLDKIIADAAAIKKEVDKLRTELDSVLLVRRLRGKCRYLT